MLDEKNLVAPRFELLALILPHAPRAKTGRAPFELETMLRIHFVGQWLGLSELAMQEALFETALCREFVGLSSVERIPERVSILRLRRLLKEHQLAEQILAAVNATLTGKGLMLREGTALDAALIAAPSSGKHKDGERDPGMHQRKKGNQWPFAVALWNEMPHRCRGRLRSGSLRGGHARQRQRRDAGWQAAPWCAN